MTSLNPVFTVGQQIAEPLQLHLGLGARAGAASAPRRCSNEVGMPEPKRAPRQPIRTSCRAASSSA